MHPQLAGFVASNSRRDPTKTAYSAAAHGAAGVDIAAVGLPQPRLRLLTMMSGNSSRRTRVSHCERTS
jgi:hypothetical protein